ncbi:hypothetical protein [Stenotrophomonas maltophilia]
MKQLISRYGIAGGIWRIVHCLRKALVDAKQSVHAQLNVTAVGVIHAGK